eukprot:gene27327-35296_t
MLLVASDLDRSISAQIWLAGSLSARSWSHAVPAALCLALIAPIALLYAQRLALLEMGDDAARQLGVSVERTRLAMVMTAVGLTAMATAATGPIAFIALAGPQLARRLCRSAGVPLLPGAAMGAVLLLAADLISQRFPSGLNLPIGSTTGMLGGAYLLWRLTRDAKVRAAIIEEGLREAGCEQLIRLSGTTGLVAAIEVHDPDVVVIDLEDPSRDALADMFLVSRHVRRPITMFVDQSDSASIEAAVEAGVSAYIVDGLKKERMRPILQTCISRFNAFRKLREELDEARSQLEDRKTIDRAKAIVMRLKGLSEEDAYALMRRTAMNEKRKLVDIARSLITAAEMLK